MHALQGFADHIQIATAQAQQGAGAPGMPAPLTVLDEDSEEEEEEEEEDAASGSSGKSQTPACRFQKCCLPAFGLRPRVRHDINQMIQEQTPWSLQAYRPVNLCKGRCF